MRCCKILFSCSISAVLGIGTAKSQLFKIDLDEKLAKSSLVIEGQVGEQYSFWNAAHTMIYTASEIVVTGIFKGKVQVKTEVITTGGTVDNYAIQASDLLQLRKGQQGIFFCNPNQLLIQSPKTKNILLDIYSSRQGFLRYNMRSDEASAPFIKYKCISSLRKIIEKKEGVIFSKTDNSSAVISETNSSNSGESTLATISSFSPATVNSGTLYDSLKNTLTINGSGFGAQPSKSCGVTFKDADNDDSDPSFKVEYTSPYFIKWSDNQIILHVPDQAGTGAFAVVLANGTLVNAATDLQVFYAVQNAGFQLNSSTFVIKEPRLVNTDGKGGYTVLYSNNTANRGTDITQSPAYETFRRALNTWKELVGPNITEGGTTSIQKINAYDGKNVVMLDNDSTGIAALSDGVLATTFSGFSVCPGGNFTAEKVGFDVLIRNTGVSKGNVDFTTGPCFPRQNEYDLEMTILHELGHALNLAHIVDDYQVTNNNLNNVNPSKLMNYAILDFVDRRSPDASAYQGAQYTTARLGKQYGNCSGIFSTEMTLTTSLTAANDECPSGFPTAVLQDNTSVFFDLTHSTSNKFGDPSFTQINCQSTGTSVTNNAYYAFTNGTKSTLTLTVSDYITTPSELANCTGEQARLALYDVSACPVGQSFPQPGACLTFTGNGDIKINGLEANHPYLLYIDGVRNTKASFNVVFNSNGNPQPGNEATIVLYPNPVHYTLNVKLSNATAGKYEFAVFDAMGRMLRHNSFTVTLPVQTFPVALSTAATGVYFIRITDSNGKKIAEEKILKY